MTTYNTTTASGVFKTKYVRMSRDMWNSENVCLAKFKRNDEFTGDQALISVPTSFSGGRGSGTLPRSNVTSYQKMLITSKKVYATVDIDNESIKASENDAGAFVRLSKEPVKRGVQAFQANMSRIVFNDSIASGGNGRLGSFSGNQTLVSTDTYDVVITATSWKQANFEVKDYANVNSSNAEFEITAVTPSTRTVRLVQRSGPTVDLSIIGAGTHNIYMQNSRNNDPTGMRGVLTATSGSAYGIPIGYRWQASSQLLNLSNALVPDLMNQQMLDVKYGFGESPDMMVTSFVQYRKLLSQLEDQKRYMIVESRNAGPRGKFSFQALEFMSDSGPVPVIAERFVEDDTFYSLNSDFVEFHARPGSGWIENPQMGGSIFFPTAEDTWQARYSMYGDWAIMPTAHGIMTGLTTS